MLAISKRLVATSIWLRVKLLPYKSLIIGSAKVKQPTAEGKAKIIVSKIALEHDSFAPSISPLLIFADTHGKMAVATDKDNTTGMFIIEPTVPV